MTDQPSLREYIKALDQALKPIKDELDVLRGRSALQKIDNEFIKETLIGLEMDITILKKEQKKQAKKLKYIKETLDLAVKNFDLADVHLHRRVERVEDRLGLPPLKN